MLQINPFFLLKKSHNKVVFNTLLWGFSFVLLLFVFSEDFSPTKIDYVYTISFFITLIIPVIINLYFLIPFFLKKEKYLIFSLLFLTNLALFTQLNIWFFNSLIEGFFSDYYFISYHSNIKIVFIFAVFLIITTLIKLSKDWIYLNKVENRTLKLEKQEIENQLSSLKAQINPHFLFNSLNVLYSLSLKNKKETTEAILQLSDILRYVLYDVSTKKITLKEEVILLEKYIDFQKSRHQKPNINFDVKVDNYNFKIYPMLLLPLIENSFKHGIKGEIEAAFIDIKIKQTKNSFSFFIENNLPKEKPVEYNNVGGLGLKNIQQNLALIYPKKHSFSTSITNNKFQVSLKINANEY
ncbi:histidine kinase [Polaribacter batillariae]|uniref:Histidine kinase n=1 Tax=Polaribacter batillariae TaxID=2808900 RepID=A0ABX7SQF2_9FLAO|nr:histidine kinase [Polaribacter batillariae]QTD36460.1 histidine kinase [Polaribacter batillariae]